MATFYVDPTAGTNGDGSEGSPFNSLQNALSGILTSFNSAEEDFIVNCLAGEDDAEEPAVIAVNATNSTPRVLRIIAEGANRHDGTRGTGYRFTHELRINNDNPDVTVELIGLGCANIQQNRSVAVTALVDSCAVLDSPGIGVHCGGGTINLRNTIVVGSTHEGVVAENDAGTGVINAVNCTVAANTLNGMLARFGGSITAINCYSGANGSADYQGVTTPTSCYSSDGSQSTSTADYDTSNFASVTEGSEDLTLVLGSELIDAGVGPAANANVPTTDFEGDERSGTTTDVGFDQFVTAGTPGNASGDGATATATAPTGSAVEISASLVFTGANIFVDKDGVPVNAADLTFHIWRAPRPSGNPNQIITDVDIVDGELTLQIEAGDLEHDDPVSWFVFDPDAENPQLFSAGVTNVVIE